MSGCCTCSPLRPRYKKLVDNIFPGLSADGLVKSCMETLTYYAATSPEKLDRIGEYLAYRIGREIHRNRKEFVKIGVEAMDQLLKSCHVNILNLYVESYLKTVQKLLESSESELQILASYSFLKFSQIEEDTPSYHRRYDFFIDRFSQMCHDGSRNAEDRFTIRMAGLQGINGVIRKTVNEDLSECLWDTNHMNKIVPALLLNLNQTESNMYQMEDYAVPCVVADQILRELVKASSFSNIATILTPVLSHMDNHHQWDAVLSSVAHSRSTEAGLSRIDGAARTTKAEAITTFEAIMYSIQVDLSYIVIEKLMLHLDSTQSVATKTAIATVLSNIIGIGVCDATVGPSALEIVNALLVNLQRSVDEFSHKSGLEADVSYISAFRTALIGSLRAYVNELPDFQEIEIIGFIVKKIPEREHDSSTQIAFLEALECVAKEYKTVHLTTSFQNELLSKLLRLLISSDSTVKVRVFGVIQALADRHDNQSKLKELSLYPGELNLCGVNDKLSRSDQVFVHKHLFHIYGCLKQVLEGETHCNVEMLEALYTTVIILTVETAGSDDSAVLLLDFIEMIQVLALGEDIPLSTETRSALHVLTICLAAQLANLAGLPEINGHVAGIIEARMNRATNMLPPLNEDYTPGMETTVGSVDQELLIQRDFIIDSLKSAGKNVQGMNSLPRQHLTSTAVEVSGSWQAHKDLDVGEGRREIFLKRRLSNISIESSWSENDDSLDCQSFDASSDPCDVEESVLMEDLTMTALKRHVLTPEYWSQNDEKERNLRNHFMQASFDEICSGISEGQRHQFGLKDYVDALFERLDDLVISIPSSYPNVDAHLYFQ